MDNRFVPIPELHNMIYDAASIITKSTCGEFIS